LVCLFGGQNKDASKKEMDEGVLALVAKTLKKNTTIK
jgi:hypothetical protein